MAEAVTEKVVRLETQMQTVAGEIAEVKSLVKEVIVKVDHFTSLQNEVQVLKDSILSLNQDILELKKNRNLLSWVIPTIAAAAGAVLTVLITSYISHGGK